MLDVMDSAELTEWISYFRAEEELKARAEKDKETEAMLQGFGATIKR